MRGRLSADASTTPSTGPTSDDILMSRGVAQRARPCRSDGSARDTTNTMMTASIEANTSTVVATATRCKMSRCAGDAPGAKAGTYIPRTPAMCAGTERIAPRSHAIGAHGA